MKRTYLILIIILTLVLSGCAAEFAEPAPLTPEPAVTDPAPAQPEVTDPAPMEPAPTEMTLEELSKFNGKDGARAYIAVDGVVYDVTDVPPWAGGTHQGKVEAGIDGSQMILQSPHGKKVLEKLPIVGKIKQ